MNNPPTISELTEQLIEFRDARDWRQFHSLKDLILSLNLEAAELLELSQWKPEADFEIEAQMYCCICCLLQSAPALICSRRQRIK